MIDSKASNSPVVERSCIECGVVDTPKWYSGPQCRKCYSKVLHKRRKAGDWKGWKEKLYAYRRRHPDRVKSSQLKNSFGITLEDYNKKLLDQQGGCGICGATTPGRTKVMHFAVDHNHTTGKVRGLLCTTCNTALGLIKEDLNIIDKMKKYIEKYNG